ncbi:MAG TPA: hypothetical protein DC054_11985 [Blastocatellia bacterium]|nr:hypothetical protein [Blastocatellia bacterium]
MQLVKTLIHENSEKFGHFSYYETVIEVIEQNVLSQPDICIESCKSLIEGISKTILKALNPAQTDAVLNRKVFKDLFREALAALAQRNPTMEAEFVRRSVGVVQVIGEIRDKRGDISHGKIAPKELASYAQFSKLIMHMTEGIAFYMLDQFFQIDLSFTEVVKYEDNDKFNEFLDRQNPMPGLSYSKALFDQDNVSYCEQLLDYQTEAEELLEDTIFEGVPEL